MSVPIDPRTGRPYAAHRPQVGTPPAGVQQQPGMQQPPVPGPQPGMQQPPAPGQQQAAPGGPRIGPQPVQPRTAAWPTATTPVRPLPYAPARPAAPPPPPHGGTPPQQPLPRYPQQYPQRPQAPYPQYGPPIPPRGKLSTAAVAGIVTASVLVLAIGVLIPVLMGMLSTPETTAEPPAPTQSSQPDPTPTPTPSATPSPTPTPEPTPEPTPTPTSKSPTGLTGADFATENQFAVNFVPYASADGAYGEAATELAAEFDIVIEWDISKFSETNCNPLTEENLNNWLAVVCGSRTDRIYVNQTLENFDYSYSIPWFIDRIKHEIAHVQISKICGVINPVNAGTNWEATTSSYAVLYFGADPNLEQYSGPNYQMTAETDAAARLIYDGDCG